MIVALALLVAGFLLEWRLLRRAHPAYFRWGLLCYATVVFPEDVSNPDEDDTPEVERRTARLHREIETRWERFDPARRWGIVALESRGFALRPRFANPLLVRARLALVDGGVSIQAFVPWSLMLIPVVLVLAADVLPGSAVAALTLAPVFAIVFALRELDRLVYRRLEPRLTSR